jgi:hypothetical protein
VRMRVQAPLPAVSGSYYRRISLPRGAAGSAVAGDSSPWREENRLPSLSARGDAKQDLPGMSLMTLYGGIFQS